MIAVREKNVCADWSQQTLLDKCTMSLDHYSTTDAIENWFKPYHFFQFYFQIHRDFWSFLLLQFSKQKRCVWS